jgi:hypothetical protein
MLVLKFSRTQEAQTRCIEGNVHKVPKCVPKHTLENGKYI